MALKPILIFPKINIYRLTYWVDSDLLQQKLDLVVQSFQLIKHFDRTKLLLRSDYFKIRSILV